MMNFVSIGSILSGRIIHVDNHEIVVTEWGAGDGVYVQIETPAEIGTPSSNMLYSFTLDELNDLFALLVSMKLIDISDIMQLTEEIDAKTNSNQLNLKL